MKSPAPSAIELIPLERITVVNPRVRNLKAFGDIVKNIGQVGLKRPITVARREGAQGATYDLVRGQGRLEAYRALGQAQIPALVIEASEEDSFVMSSVENIARHQHRAVDLLHHGEADRVRRWGRRRTRSEPTRLEAIRQPRASLMGRGHVVGACRHFK